MDSFRKTILKKSPNKKNADDLISVLCFGDSITKGYYCYGCQYHPYSNKLEHYLKEHYGLKDIKITSSGVNGEVVHDQMEKRLKETLAADRFDYVIILGGLNDLAYHDTEEGIDLIVGSFRNMYKLLDDNTHVKKFIHITVPYCKHDTISEYKTCKDDLNNKILGLHSDKRYTVDLSDHNRYKFNYLLIDEELRKVYWDDNLHFTPDGYDLLAKCVFESFQENIDVL